MTFVIGVVSQKGGVGKSTIARLLGREMAAGGLRVKIADLDIQQATSYHWAKRRAEAKLEPEVRIETFQSVKTALAEAGQFDVFIIDGAPHASRETREIAKAADLIVIPTGQAVDDLYPTVLLAHDLRKEGIPMSKVAIALWKISDSGPEQRAARVYLERSGYNVLKGDVPFRTAYGKASDEGRALSETNFRTLNRRAEELAQSIVDAAAAAREKERAVA
ncbi:AAA family ATPase [Hyphomicrobium sp. MC8b]|uniref:nucleotide-binding protein n=1 Tax=Hyphomicrobium sp. MC8b TaxID=300273 RepID=UPI003919327C